MNAAISVQILIATQRIVEAVVRYAKALIQRVWMVVVWIWIPIIATVDHLIQGLGQIGKRHAVKVSLSIFKPIPIIAGNAARSLPMDAVLTDRSVILILILRTAEGRVSAVRIWVLTGDAVLVIANIPIRAAVMGLADLSCRQTIKIAGLAAMPAVLKNHV
jgi:hypothetical protein